MKDNSLNLIETVLEEVIQESNTIKRFQQVLDNGEDKRLQKSVDNGSEKLLRAKRDLDQRMISKSKEDEKEYRKRVQATRPWTKSRLLSQVVKDVYASEADKYDKLANEEHDKTQELIEKGRRNKENYKRMLNTIPNATITTNRRGKTEIKYEAAQILIETLNILLNE